MKKESQPLLIDIKETAKMVGLSRSTINSKVREKTFPLPVKISERRIMFKTQEIIDWVDKLPRAYYSNESDFPIIGDEK